ncbi:DoxX family protein [Nakamurella sp. YIM 132087]|uniref:DoxX family protein n=1 Tax=Nakamurella alba TaxID=2665158 RepID=A0A7K1FPY5_9ACTN|nr:DoxX family protein [Nakamurella alba]MTD14874.1 DoxX family protein [Nakamurella alba]
MTVAYWVVAILLAVFYLYAGGMKVVRSKEQLLPMMAWVDTTPLALVRAIGIIEILGAIGLILPPLTGVAPGLALAAAVGLVLVQIGAIALHLRRGETKVLGLNIVLIALAAVATWLATVWI